MAAGPPWVRVCIWLAVRWVCDALATADSGLQGTALVGFVRLRTRCIRKGHGGCGTHPRATGRGLGYKEAADWLLGMTGTLAFSDAALRCGMYNVVCGT